MFVSKMVSDSDTCIDIERPKIDCLSVMCPLLVQLKTGFLSIFFCCSCLQYYETNKASLKQSIILRCLWTHDSHYFTCLGHLGWHDTDRTVSIFCHAVQGGQGKYKCVTHRPIYRPVVLLLYVVVAGNITPTFAIVNTALAFTGDVIKWN